jgi:hypothetical protein
MSPMNPLSTIRANGLAAVNTPCKHGIFSIHARGGGTSNVPFLTALSTFCVHGLRP